MRRLLSVIVGTLLVVTAAGSGASADLAGAPGSRALTAPRPLARPPAPTGVVLFYTDTFQLYMRFDRDPTYSYVEQLYDGSWVSRDSVERIKPFQFSQYRVAAIADGVRGPWTTVDLSSRPVSVVDLEAVRSELGGFRVTWRSPDGVRPTGYGVAAWNGDRWDVTTTTKPEIRIADTYESVMVAPALGGRLAQFTEIPLPIIGPVRDLAYVVKGKTVVTTWKKPLVDNPRRSFQYQIEGAERDGDWRRLASRSSTMYTLPSSEPDVVRLRVRAFGSGEVGEWVEIILNRDAVVDISIGHGHACALVVDGTVRCWGYNKYGQTGATPGSSSNEPRKVAGVSNVVDIEVGYFHTCALDAKAKVWCWGYNAYGQLGDGTTASRNTPKVVPKLSGVASLATGFGHTCVALNDGSVRCWGDNTYLQSGVEGERMLPTPTEVRGANDIVRISAGRGSTCGVTSTGGFVEPKSLTGREEDPGVVYCWGDNIQGSLGNGSQTPSARPVRVVNFQGFSELSVGADFACAAYREGDIGLTACWGAASDGQLAISEIMRTHYEEPTLSDGFGVDVKSVSAGAYHSCAVKLDATLWCSGDDSQGQIGDGPDPNYTRFATQVPDFSAVMVDAGVYSTCAIDTQGRPWCWGENLQGQLGDGTTTGRTSPMRVKDLG